MSLATQMMAAINWALDRGISAERTFPVHDLSGRRQGPTPLIAAAQNYTSGSWADLGPEVAVDGYTRATLWINHVNNQNTGTLFRCLVKHTTGGAEEYSMPIYNPIVTASPYYANADLEYVRLAADSSQQIALTWDIGNTVPFIQFQCQATTTGSSVGNVASAYVTYGWGS